MIRSRLLSESEALNELKARLAGSDLGPLLENIHALTVLLDPDGALVAWNPAFDILRRNLAEAGKMQELFGSPSAAPLFQRSMQSVLQSGKPARFRLEPGSLSRTSGYDCILLKQPNGLILLIGGPAAAADELEQLKAQLEKTRSELEVKHTELQAVLAQADEVSHTDALTFLPNRRWILSDLQQQVTYSERYGSPLSISMIDVDYFKDINDNFGHGIGDQVLRFVASEMRDHIRQPDQIGRYGGDEFLVILQNTPLPAAAEQASRLCKVVGSTPFMAGKEEIHVGLSIGIAQYKVNEDDWHSLLERADQALYQAKNSGRGQWAILEA